MSKDSFASTAYEVNATEDYLVRGEFAAASDEAHFTSYCENIERYVEHLLGRRCSAAWNRDSVFNVAPPADSISDPTKRMVLKQSDDLWRSRFKAVIENGACFDDIIRGATRVPYSAFVLRYHPQEVQIDPRLDTVTFGVEREDAFDVSVEDIDESFVASERVVDVTLVDDGVVVESIDQSSSPPSAVPAEPTSEVLAAVRAIREASDDTAQMKAIISGLREQYAPQTVAQFILFLVGRRSAVSLSLHNPTPPLISAIAEAIDVTPITIEPMGDALFTEDPQSANAARKVNQSSHQPIPDIEGFIGRALGYPPQAVRWYKKHSSTRPVTTAWLMEVLAHERDAGNLSREDMRFLKLIPFVVPARAEVVHDAVERGRRHAEALREFDATYDVHVGQELLYRFKISDEQP